MSGQEERVKLELEIGREALKEAEKLFESGFLRGAISRLYYALFHHVRALLFDSGFDPKTHDGVKTLFGLHFVRSGKVDPADARLFTKLAAYREDADYSPATIFDEGTVREEIGATKQFIQNIEKLL